MDSSKEAVRLRQRVFVMTVKACFMGKLAKYNGHLVKQGIHIDYNTVETLTRSTSFDDNIELILCESSASIHSRQIFKKIGNHLSLVKVVRFIYQLVQRTKAARILSHLNGVSQKEIKDVVTSVAMTLSVAFEYQLMMLFGEGEVIKVAMHAVSCMMFYLNTRGAVFTVKELITAVLEVKPRTSKNKDILKVHTAYANNQPFNLKWKLGQLFKQPGLRIRAEDVNAEMKGQHLDGENDNFETLDTPDTPSAIATDEEKGTASNEKVSYGGVQDVNEEDEVASKPVAATEIKLDEVSATILGKSVHEEGNGSPTKPYKPERRIKTIEMDYEMGKLHIEEHNITVSDCSPTDDSFDITDGFEEDLDEIAEDLVDDDTNRLENDNKKEDLMDRTEFETTTQDTDESENIAKIPEDSETRETLNGIADTEGKPSDNESVTYPEISNGLADTQPNICSPENKNSDYKFYGCFTPYGAKCCPDIYGFRGPLHVLDEEEGYTLIYRDKVTVRSRYNSELGLQPGNPHQAYSPKTIVVMGNIMCI